MLLQIYGLIWFMGLCYSFLSASTRAKLVSIRKACPFQFPSIFNCVTVISVAIFVACMRTHSFFLIQNEVLNAYKQINCCATGPLVVKGVVVNLYCQFQITAKHTDQNLHHFSSLVHHIILRQCQQHTILHVTNLTRYWWSEF